MNRQSNKRQIIKVPQKPDIPLGGPSEPQALPTQRIHHESGAHTEAERATDDIRRGVEAAGVGEAGAVVGRRERADDGDQTGVEQLFEDGSRELAPADYADS
jgi:hypothetical protein